MKRLAYIAALATLTGNALANTCTIRQAGATDQTVVVEFIDESTGVPNAGLAFNTAGIDLEYVRLGAAAVDITEATQTAAAAHTDGGFVSVGHGRYRLDLPDAAVAAGVPEVTIQGVITGYIMLPCAVALSPSVNLASANSASIENADFATAPGASGGLLISGSNAGTTTLGALTITGVTTHTGATVHTGNVSMAAGLNITQSSSNTPALVVTGNGTGNGATFTSGSGATGNGLSAVAASTNGHGLNLAGTGTGSGALTTGGATGHGLNAVGGATSGSGVRAVASTSGSGILATGVGTTQAGIAATGGSTSSAGISAAGGGTGAGILATAGATGSGMSLVGGATSGHALATTVTQPLGSVPGFGIQEAGTLQSATATTAVLRAATAISDDNPIGMTIEIVGGTGVGQSRTITDWVSSTDTATVATWTTTPDNTSDYYVWGTSAASGGAGGATAAEVWAHGDRQLTAFDEDATTIDVNGTTIGTVTTATTTTNLTNLPNIPANWLTAAGTAADFSTEINSGMATQASVDDIPTNAELATSQAAADDATLAAIAALPADIRDTVIEDQGSGITLGCALAIAAAYAAGDLVTTGASTTYEESSGTETRIVGTVASGSRVATITCPTY